MEQHASGEAAPTQHVLLQQAIRRLREAGLPSPRRNAEWLLAEVLECGRAALYAYPSRRVDPEGVRTFETLLARRMAREPLQYILGYTEFYGLQLQVTPDVLIPRPETEEVVDRALRLIEGIEAPRVLDVGTGSGCIALAIQHERPDATVWACDVSEPALAVARGNAKRHDFDIHFLEADVLADDFVKHAPSTLDLLISNPPYVPRDEAETLPAEVRDHEPAEALFTSSDPLQFYRTLAHHALRLLAPGGLLVVEIHVRYAEEVVTLFGEVGLTDMRCYMDLARRARIVTAWL